MSTLPPEIGLAQLHYFVAVVDTGGFQAAAQALGRSQPALSQAVRSLEGQLGGTLIERGSRGRPTALGASFLPLARELVDRGERTLQAGRNLAAGVAGRVTVAAVPSVASRLVPPILADFLGGRHDLHVTLLDEPSATVRERVQAGRADFGIASGEGVPGELSFTPLFDDPVVAVFAADHPLAAAPGPVAWAALRTYPLIDNGTTALLAQAGQRAAFADAALAVPNIVSLLSVLETGLGVTTLPRLAVPAGRALAVRPLADIPASPRRVGLVQRAHTPLPPAAEALCARLRAELPAAAAAG